MEMANDYLSERNKLLQQENNKLRAQLERREKEITNLKQHLLIRSDANKWVQQLTDNLRKQLESREKEITDLKQHLLISSEENTWVQQENNNLREQLESREETTNQLLIRIDELEKQNKWLLMRIIELKKRQCASDCVVCAVTWICEKQYPEEGVKLCHPQLSRILTAHAVGSEAQIGKEDLKCEQFMEILEKSAIVKKVVEHQNDNSTWQTMGDKAWKTLTTIDCDVFILGRLATPPAVGHAVVCCKKPHGIVTIHDPQSNNNERNLSQNMFRDYVSKDFGIILYAVNLQKLKMIISECENVLHLSSEQRRLCDNEHIPGDIQ